MLYLPHGHAIYDISIIITTIYNFNKYLSTLHTVVKTCVHITNKRPTLHDLYDISLIFKFMTTYIHILYCYILVYIPYIQYIHGPWVCYESQTSVHTLLHYLSVIAFFAPEDGRMGVVDGRQRKQRKPETSSCVLPIFSKSGVKPCLSLIAYYGIR